ncbi:MAG: NAD-dependent epimerase/dehydratase family protein [Oligoflexia bacterium]|nr:NAD-dependent epimerase/dehydratase family protein [Oligoflexia bacterium]
MKALVTGAAGFIGSSLVDRLLAEGYTVAGVDNFSTGRREFLKGALENPKFRLHERDLFDEKSLRDVLTSDFTHVFHLAANADVRDGLKHPRKDLEQNTIVTWNVLEAMRHAGVKNIGFSSTGSVYGEAPKIPTPEDCPFPVQTSLYGASKLAGEGLISAYAEGYGFQARIFRFVSILGERYTHGHVFDFFQQLRKDSSTLRVLGNGKQRKSYLYIQDCIDAILATTRHTTGKPVEIYNLGTDEYVEVNESIDVICDELKVKPTLEYSGGDRGWVGDNPFIFLDCTKLRAIGWKPKKTIREAVRLTVQYLEGKS